MMTRHDICQIVYTSKFSHMKNPEEPEHYQQDLVSLTYLVDGHVSPHATSRGENHTALATLEHTLALVAAKYSAT